MTTDLTDERRKQAAGSEHVDEPACPGPDCLLCKGEACNLCGAGCGNQERWCDHDVADRHRAPGDRLRAEQASVREHVERVVKEAALEALMDDDFGPTALRMAPIIARRAANRLCVPDLTAAARAYVDALDAAEIPHDPATSDLTPEERKRFHVAGCELKLREALDRIGGGSRG